MHSKTIALVLLSSVVACHSNITYQDDTPSTRSPVRGLNATLHVGGIALPAGYSRKQTASTGFAHWLRNIPLKADNTVYLFDGSAKKNQAAQYAVLDIPVEHQDQQCADAIMKLRAEFLFLHTRYAELSFADNAGTVYQFTPPYSRENFKKYLRRVFGMCGTASLASQMISIPIQQIAVGDVLVRGGFPGHAVIVVDLAKNAAGRTIYMLAQSYMPAQDIHILKNPADAGDSPWYELSEEKLIRTPEFTFKSTELRRW